MALTEPHMIFRQLYFIKTVRKIPARIFIMSNCKEKEFIFYHYGSDAYDDIIWNLKLLTNNRTAYLNQYNKLTFIDSSKTK